MTSRRTHALIAAGLALLLALPASGHEPAEEPVLEPGTYLSHTVLHQGTLAAGEWNNTTLAWGGTPLRSWWFLLFSGRVEGDGHLEAMVVHDTETVHAWTWEPSGEDRVVFRLEETAFHELRLHNPGPGNATYRMFYDNTCDCTSKVALMQESPLWFNYNVTAPGKVGLDFAVVPFTGPPPLEDPPALGDVRVEATVATWKGGSDAWPEGFHVVRTYETTFRGLTQEYGTFGSDFEADRAGTYYILVTLRHESDEAWRFQVRPVVDLPEDKEAPAAGVMALLASLLLVAVASRRPAPP